MNDDPVRSDIRARLDALDRRRAHEQREGLRRPRAWTVSLIWFACVALVAVVLLWLS